MSVFLYSVPTAMTQFQISHINLSNGIENYAINMLKILNKSWKWQGNTWLRTEKYLSQFGNIECVVRVVQFDLQVLLKELD